MSSVWRLAPAPATAAGRIAVVVCLWVIGPAVPAAASQDERASTTYTATAWSEEDGLPAGDVFAMAQDRDGFLWLGTGSGLVRFDGHQFVPWQTRSEAPLPVETIPALVGASDGSLWAGYGVGGVVRIHEGRVHRYAAGEQGVPPGRVSALLEDRSARIWLGSSGGLAVFQDGAWQPVDQPGPFHAAEVSSLYEDRDGTIWVGTSAGVLRRPHGGSALELVHDGVTYVQGFVEDPAGRLWITDTQHIVRRLDTLEQAEYAPGVRLPTAGWRSLAARNGDVWVAALGGGLLRLRTDSRTGRARIEHAGNAAVEGSPRSLFEDRDGNIWIGIRGAGLVRLSVSPFTIDVALEGITNDGVRALTASSHGGLWVATGHSLNRLAGPARQAFDVNQTLAMHEDRTGTLWVATALALGRLVDGHLAPVPVSPRVRLERIASMTTDAGGRPWLCSLDQGLLSEQEGVIAPHAEDELTTGMPCTFTYTDRLGRVWVAFSRGGVAVYDDTGRTMYDAAAGAPVHPVLTMFEDSAGALWLATASTLSRLLHGRFTTMGPGNLLPGKLGPSLVEDGEGHLWLSADSGSNIIRLHRREIDAVAAKPSHAVRYALYDRSDGLLSELHWLSRPGAAVADDGRLWFVTGRGVAVIDPRSARARADLSAVRIERGLVGERPIAPAPNTQLPASSSLHVDYTAPSLSAGTKLRFRHFLEGYDSEWVDAGTRRYASYPALPSGSYRLRVAATGGDEWNESEAVWSFVVQAPFYQTAWFYGAGVMLSALLVLAYSRLRLRNMRSQFALVSAERVRVSREIHDTLLQSLGAVGLELEVVASELDPSQHSSREALRRLRRKVVSCIGEARQSIWELRSPLLESRSLADALREFADELTSSRAVDIGVAVFGRARECDPLIAHQLLRIAQEATNNALRHGQPKQVRVELHYEPRSLMLRVRDDGCGFTPGVHAESWMGEHWGLVSMRERAARINGRFTIDSRPGSGTIVEVGVPTDSRTDSPL